MEIRNYSQSIYGKLKYWLNIQMAGYVRKYAKKAKQVAKKRYFKGGKYRKPNVLTMARDINMLRGMLNSEKKQYTLSTASSWYKVGQVNGNTSGHFIVGFTPSIPQGTESGERIGKQVKLTSFHIDLQLYAQSAAVSGNKFIFEIWDVVGQAPDSLTDFMGDVFTFNPFVTNNAASIYDNTANRQVHNFKNYRCAYRKSLYLQADDIDTQVAVKNYQLGKRYGKNGHMVTWAPNGSQTVTQGYQVMTIRADSGNNSTSSGSGITGIPINAANTGAWLKYQVNHYYIDN
jgi:hypothetical protein